MYFWLFIHTFGIGFVIWVHHKQKSWDLRETSGAKCSRSPSGPGN